MNIWLKRIVLALSTILVALSLKPEGGIIVGVFLLSLIALNAGALWYGLGTQGRQQIAISLIGFILPWASMGGSGTILCCALLALFFLPVDKKRVFPVYATPFVIVCLCWVVAELTLSFDWEMIRQIYLGETGTQNPGGIFSVREWLRSAPPHYYTSFEMWLRYLMIFVYARLFLDDQRNRDGFVAGIVFGLVPGAILTAMQLTGVLPSLYINQNAVWNSLHRGVGSFTDANAFGIFSILVLPVVFAWAKKRQSIGIMLGFFLIALWLGLGLLSGSRSFVVGLGIYALFILYQLGKRYFYGALLGLLFGVLIVNGFATFSPELYSQATSSLPLSLQRVLSSVNFSVAGEALFSRQAFLQAAIHMWMQYPLFGVGFGGFRFAYPTIAAQLGIDTGVWTDNANNFYLGVLSEMGLVGFICLILSFIQCKWNRFEKFSWQAPLGKGLVCLLVLLLVGPHIDFDEVALLAALFLGSVVTPRPLESNNYLKAVLAIVLFAGVFYSLSHLDRGFYSWEKGNGKMLRWTERRARGVIECAADSEATLVLAALNPDLGKYPLLAEIRTDNGRVVTKQISSPGAQKVKISCLDASSKEQKEEGISPPEVKKIYYQLSLSRVWTPAWYGQGADKRVLGVQVISQTALP